MQLNLIGAGLGWNLAPLDGISWGINNVIFKRPVNLLFDMHDHTSIAGSRKDKCEEIAEECRKSKTPCFSIKATDWYMKFPIEEIMGYFGTRNFSNGVCYMIALAIYQGATEINLYGVNHNRYISGNEYVNEKPSVDYWVGVGRGMGVKINIHGELSMVGKTLTDSMYGYI